MANIKEINLIPVSIHECFLEDCISAILHTILFVRASNIGKPKDNVCKLLRPLIYAKCGPADIDQTVSTAVDILRKSFAKINRESSPPDNSPTRKCWYRGELNLSFYDHREVKEFLGLVTRSENIYFERWNIVINLHCTASPNASVVYYDTAYDETTKALMNIMESVNIATDHVPLCPHHFEIQVREPNIENDTLDGRDHSIVSRLINSPAIFSTMR